MSRPRRIVPNSTVLLTRRATQRLFLLRPDKRTTKIINYCLAEAAKRHRIELITWLFMSNHYHAVVYDRYGLLPQFTAHFHKMIAKALNHRWLRRENFWSSAETSVTILPTQEDVLRKVVYVLTNPVKAHLVDRVEDWPGASSWGYMNGRPRKHERPSGYFKKKKTKTTSVAAPRGRRRRWEKREMPKSVLLRAVPPRASMIGEPAICADVWRRSVRERVAEQEKALRAVRRQEGINLVTKGGVLRQKHTESPSTEEPRNKVRPTLACHDKKRRKEWRKTLSDFREKHERARRKWVKGNHTVLFPPGTYRMRLLGARCEPSPD